MSVFKSSNPTLSEKIFNRSIDTATTTETMTVRGTMNKFAFLLIMVVAGAAYTWNMAASAYNMETLPSLFLPLVIGGAIGGLILAIIMSFKPSWSPYLAPVYGLLEGFFVGGISVIVNYQMTEKGYDGSIVMQAVGLTFGVAIAMFLLYNFRIIQPTKKFKSIIFAATAGIALFYLIRLVLSFFGIQMPFMQFGDNSLLGIGISLFIVAIAALNLIMDFGMIEEGADNGAPKYMEWFGAFGLMVTIVWLYIEILRLLSRFAKK